MNQPRNNSSSKPNPKPRKKRQAVHGVLLLNKPLGMTSNQAVQKVRWLLNAKKAGHTGTLDPLATGVLPICLGAATKYSQLQLDADKSYAAELQLGVTREGGDLEGEVVQQRTVPALTDVDLRQLEAKFTGEVSQTPPMHSALKHNGTPLYKLARQGIVVEREARQVTVRQLQLELLAPDRLRLSATVSKGTYIRVLAEDIGEALGCGAHLSALNRTATANLSLSQCIELADFEALTDKERLAHLQSIPVLLDGYVEHRLSAEQAGFFLHGQRLRVDAPDAAKVAVYGPHPAGEGASSQSTVFLGTGHIQSGELIADRLLNPLEVAETVQQFPMI